VPRFSANIAMPFRERPFLERLGAARATGFEAVEMPFPYAAVPGREARFREAVEEGREWALRLGCRRLNVLAGHRAPWLERGHALSHFRTLSAYPRRQRHRNSPPRPTRARQPTPRWGILLSHRSA
jgi:hydroxypyruvate isomerase